MQAIYKKFEANNLLFGISCVLLATLGLSLKAIFIKLAYLADVSIDSISMLSLRFLLALPFFLIILYFSKKSNITPVAINTKHAVQLFLLGAIGFYGSAILDFSALAYISAGIERLILFLYPTFVVIISLFIRPSEITSATIGALILSYVGVLVVFVQQTSQLDANMIKGIIMVFAAALLFAIYTVASVKSIRNFGSIRFTVYASLAATLTTLTHGLCLDGLDIFNHNAKVYVIVLLMAIFSTVLPLILMAEGVKRVGASNASVISTSGPVLTITLAYFFLGESIGIWQALGGLLIITGVYLVASQKKKPV